MQNNVILGAGVSGISAAYHLKLKGEQSVIFERDSDWGGLCGFFEFNGFRFDRFVHFTFASDEYVKNLFEKSSKTFSHPPVSYNYWRGCWLKHPAQNNLAPLPIDEKVKIISSFINKPLVDVSDIKDYSEWLYAQYGEYFAENFPFAYTRKYWGVEPKELETKWVGNRLHVSPIEEVLKGSYEEQKENFYYTKFMKYPLKGGYRSILDLCRREVDIKFNKEVIKIDPINKQVKFKDNTAQSYDRLISSLPLPEIIAMLDNVPKDIIEAVNNLHWTSGYQISLGFNRPDVAKHLWFYIYDEDIPPARVYSPNLKSSDNVPNGCSSLQAEVFWDCKTEKPNKEVIFNKTIESLKKLCGFKDSDVVLKDIRYEKYSNVSFTHSIYESRAKIRDYLDSLGIQTIGRFGEWDYLWSHQAFMSGMNV